MTKHDVLAAWRSNPFFVLGVDVQASSAEIERAGQKLLALIAIGAANAGGYDTPVGPALRDADSVRTALAQLREPNERIVFELLANVAPIQREAGPENAIDAWETNDVIGWNPRWVD